MTIDEIFATMADEGAEGGHEYLIIDPETRAITVPESERIFGVTGDELADRKYFMCPRYVGDGLDLAGMFLTVYFRTATDYEDGYLVDDVAVNGEYITFSWLLSSSVTEYKGTVQFSVCADLPNTAEKRRPDWNTTLASGEVLEGLDPDVGDVVGETSDLVTQLRAEIAASTAAVEAAGASQVDVVEAAGAAATAAAQEQIEAKGAATLATIPADYTTLANKTNEQANAIKGHLAGEIVQAGDVSPVEHFLGVSVRGKNLFPVNSATASKTAQAYTFVKLADIVAEPGQYVLTCDFVQSGADLSKICASVRDIDSYTEIMAGASSTEANGSLTVPFTVAEGKRGFAVYLYSNMTADALTTRCDFANIQVEKGTEATEYTPYIDPAGVTVNRCGKNLIDYKKPVLSYSIESTEINNGLHLAGRYMASFPVSIPAGTAVTMSWNTANAEGSVVDDWRVQYADNTYSQHCKNGVAMVPQLPVVQACLYVNKGDADGAADFTNIQLELGDAATEYEPYSGATAMPDAAGIVTGLPSLAPTMTLLTDTVGVTIDCIYNRDSNAVYAELLAKIAALSGTN
jgi:hypothetical protein